MKTTTPLRDKNMRRLATQGVISWSKYDELKSELKAAPSKDAIAAELWAAVALPSGGK